MKKTFLRLLTVFVCIAMIASLAACGNTGKEPEETTAPQTEATTAAPTGIPLYFFADGKADLTAVDKADEVVYAAKGTAAFTEDMFKTVKAPSKSGSTFAGWAINLGKTYGNMPLTDASGKLVSWASNYPFSAESNTLVAMWKADTAADVSADEKFSIIFYNDCIENITDFTGTTQIAKDVSGKLVAGNINIMSVTKYPQQHKGTSFFMGWTDYQGNYIATCYNNNMEVISLSTDFTVGSTVVLFPVFLPNVVCEDLTGDWVTEDESTAITFDPAKAMYTVKTNGETSDYGEYFVNGKAVTLYSHTGDSLECSYDGDVFKYGDVEVPRYVDDSELDGWVFKTQGITFSIERFTGKATIDFQGELFDAVYTREGNTLTMSVAGGAYTANCVYNDGVLAVSIPGVGDFNLEEVTTKKYYALFGGMYNVHLEMNSDGTGLLYIEEDDSLYFPGNWTKTDNRIDFTSGNVSCYAMILDDGTFELHYDDAKGYVFPMDEITWKYYYALALGAYDAHINLCSDGTGAFYIEQEPDNVYVGTWTLSDGRIDFVSGDASLYMFVKDASTIEMHYDDAKGIVFDMTDCFPFAR